MFRKFLFWFSGKRPIKFIPINGKPYMERYFLCKIFGLTFYLHRFINSDGERNTHDHPWNSFAFVLSGWYIEQYVYALSPDHGALTVDRKIRWFNRIGINHFHRIKQTRPDTWTLFIHSEEFEIVPNVKKGWGILNQRNPIKLSEYNAHSHPHSTYTKPEHHYQNGYKHNPEWYLTAPSPNKMLESWTKHRRQPHKVKL